MNASWARQGITVAGSDGHGNDADQLDNPLGLFVDGDQMIFIAEQWNHRILQWKLGDTNGRIAAGGHGKGKRLNQLDQPTDVLIDKETDNLIICDQGNHRVVRWSRRSLTTKGEILLDDINCYGLALDDHRCLYISDEIKHEVRRYHIGNKNGTIVAGGHGEGDGLNQLNQPSYLFVDRQQAVYVSDTNNHRVMKWNKGAKEVILNISVNAQWAQKGSTVAGGYGNGRATNQLNTPMGLCIDEDQTMVIADFWNHRIVQWKLGDKDGLILADGRHKGNRSDRLYWPTNVLIEKESDSLIICDPGNQRVLRWSRLTFPAQRESLVENINCWGLALDDQGYLYISDEIKHEVRRYHIGNKNGTIVAGGHGEGDGLNQLNRPRYLFVDRQQAVYVSDTDNHRVMKWNKNAKEGIIIYSK
ncbi:unnamed protein product [Rotaria sp. Silwood1]|nr:unnamed protein product [Rotaria sp. Silwood1]CAF4823848.1 unnamed protein product [Rotaria sp. Silwood1]